MNHYLNVFSFINLKVTTAFIMILGTLQSCTNDNKPAVSNKPKAENSHVVDSKYISEYAGGYTVELDSYKGDAAEAYILKSDGTAKWMYIKNNGGQAQVEDEKSGTWIAKEKSISITCEGNTDSLTEEFAYKNGRFYDTLTGERYLKRNK